MLCIILAKGFSSLLQLRAMVLKQVRYLLKDFCRRVAYLKDTNTALK